MQTIITQPGIYDMPNDAYHADPCIEPSLSSSIAKLMVSRSPMHAMLSHPRLNPDFEHEDSDKFDLGSAAHDYLLNHGRNIAICFEADDWRKKSAQEFRDAMREEGKIPVLQKQHDKIAAMGEAAIKALAESPDLQIELASGRAEQSFFWNDDGAWCRSRPDWYSQELELLLDYKTTSGSANPGGMARLAASLSWDIQAGHYMRGYRKLIGERKKLRFVFMIQENEAPYAVSFCGMDGTFLAMGDDKADRAINAWRKCIKAKEWPSYTQRIVYPDPPAYHQIEWEESPLCVA